MLNLNSTTLSSIISNNTSNTHFLNNTSTLLSHAISNETEINDLHDKFIRAIDSAKSQYFDHDTIAKLCQYIFKNHPEAYKHMVDTILENYDNSLHVASDYKDIGIIKILIDGGADVNARDTFESTPLHHAVVSGDVGVVQILLDNGADINIMDNADYTPLQYAKRSRAKPEILEILTNAVTEYQSSSISSDISQTSITDQDVTTHITDKRIDDKKSDFGFIGSIVGIVTGLTASTILVMYSIYNKCFKSTDDINPSNSDISLHISAPSVTQFMTRPVIECVKIMVDEKPLYLPIEGNTKSCFVDGGDYRPLSEFVRFENDQKQQPSEDIQKDNNMTKSNSSDHYDKPQLPIACHIYNNIDECGYVAMLGLGVVTKTDDIAEMSC